MRSILLLLAVPALASAQTTNTNCFVNGQWVNCTSQTRPPIDLAPTDFLGAMGGVQSLPDPYREQQEVLRDRQAAQLRQQQIELQRLELQRQQSAAPSNGPPPEFLESWAQLADLIKAHRCDEAIDLAIRHGGTEAGLRVKQICQ